MKRKLLLLTLNTFSATGGIEKVCRTAGKALYEIASETGGEFLVYSMYDDTTQVEEAYFPAAVFKGFGGKRLQFVRFVVNEGSKAHTVLLSHVNLLPIGYLIKKVAPKTRLVLMAHGIEVWESLSWWKQKMIRAVDLFLAVSSFTAEKLRSQHRISEKRIRVLNNCIDPFLRNERNAELDKELRLKYGIEDDDFLLLTVTRLKFSEQYKGYDKVVRSMASLKKSHPKLKYLIVGKWDEEEKARLDIVIANAGLDGDVILAGFAKDEELGAHFQLADAYIMPSTGEGFGIVFIEALFYGLPVIAGNADGSVDALAGGEFGALVNPHKPKEIEQAIADVYINPEKFIPEDRKVITHFGFIAYKNRLRLLLGNSGQAESVVRCRFQSASAR